MEMDNDTTDGITLQNTMPLNETTTIDWDAVLRDFAGAHLPSDTAQRPPAPPPPPSLKSQNRI